MSQVSNVGETTERFVYNSEKVHRAIQKGNKLAPIPILDTPTSTDNEATLKKEKTTTMRCLSGNGNSRHENY